MTVYNTDYTNKVGPSEKQNSKEVGCDFYLLVVVCTCATPPAFEKQMLAGSRLGLLGYIGYIEYTGYIGYIAYTRNIPPVK